MSVSNHNSPDRPTGPEFVKALEAALGGSIPGREDLLIATGARARRFGAEQDELRAMRLHAVGGSVFKRDGSPFWQLKYRLEGKWRYETSGTSNRREAERMLASRVYEASAGLLPGTASIEQILDVLLNDAKVRGLKAVGRLERAVKALRAKLAGLRAEQIDQGRWLQYAADRQAEGIANDTIHFELWVARRAYSVARVAGLVRAIPVMPRMKLHVRHGFVTPEQWRSLRLRLRPELADAGDFALLTGAREMEVLALPWSDVDVEQRVIHLRATKTGRPRAVPYSSYPQLADVVARRIAQREQLKREGVITPWVFCSASGRPLFKTRASGDRELLTALRDEWNAACRDAGRPGTLFHDLRRSAARNLERASVPRSIAMKLCGWTERMYSRYAIGAESEIEPALGELSEHLRGAGWHSSGTPLKTRGKSGSSLAEGGGSRTLRQPQWLPGRF